MTEPLQVIIDRAASGELELSDACAALEHLASSEMDEGDGFARALEMEIETGRLSRQIGGALLDVVRRRPRTRMRRAPATLLHPPAPAVAVDPTRQRVDSELLRPSPDGGLAAGSVIKDRFLLEDMIGRGGMGLVFSAQDRRKQEALDPNPRVAIK